MTALDRAKSYLNKVPGAVSGQGGNKRTFFVGCLLVNDFGLGTSEALEIFEDWNKKCDPPWSRDELVKKLESASFYSSQKKNNNTGTTKNKKVTLACAPEPLYRELPTPNEFPFHALGNILGPAALRVNEVVKAPDAICGQSFLAAGALAVQSYGDIYIDGRTVAISLFFISIASSGERKSAVDSISLYPHRQYQKNLLREYEKSLKSFEIKLGVYESKIKYIKQVSKKKSIDAIEKEILDIGPKPILPIHPMLLIAEPTFPGLYLHLYRGRGFAGLFTDEAGLFIGGHGMNQDNQLAMVTGCSKLWDGKELDRVRVEGGSTQLSGKRLSMHLMGQPDVVSQLIENPLIRNQGFTNRCLLAFPESMAGRRPYDDINLDELPEIKSYRNRISKILATQLPIEVDTENELKPRPIKLSSNAKVIWLDFYNFCEGEMLKDGLFFQIVGFASKAPEHVLRIAGVLELISDLEAEKISVKTMSDAIIIAEYYLNEAVRLISVSQVTSELNEAKVLLDWLLKQPAELIYSTKICQYGPPTIRNKTKLKKVMSILEDHNWVILKDDGAMVDGKMRKNVWRVVR